MFFNDLYTLRAFGFSKINNRVILQNTTKETEFTLLTVNFIYLLLN